MLNYVYKVTWNECPDEDTFPTFPEAKDFINQKTATGNPNYVSPFIYEIELVEDENGMFVPTGDDVCVFSWDDQTGKPDTRQPKLFDEDEYEGQLAYDPEFDVYSEFGGEEKADIPQPEQLSLFDLEEASDPDSRSVEDIFVDTINSWGLDDEVDEKETKAEQPNKDDEATAKVISDTIATWDQDKFDEALTALNEADENFGECQCCHEEFAKSDLIKDDNQRYICKKCAYDLGIEESLEETVPEDLADDRTPIQGNIHVLGEPVDYKKEIAKEKLVDESYNAEEFGRYMVAANKLGLETGADIVKFSAEHGNVKDKELLKVMEEEAAKLG